jgi:hypothetical protein
MKMNANMNNRKKINKYTKLMVIGLMLMLCLVWLAGCGNGNDDTKETGNNGVVAEQPGDTQNDTDGIGDGSQDGGDSATDNGGNDTGGSDSSSTSDGDKDQTGSEPGSATGTGGGSDSNPGTTTPSTVTIQINCSLLVGKDLSGTGLETLVPADGIILPTTKVTLNPGETVYDLTLRVTKGKKIHMASEGSQAMGNLYIAAIGNIYEKAYNSKSGWVYLINGTKPGIGSGEQTLKAGDKLVWAYSLNLGNDL